jgi:ADP-heptose:LPS heptosyltransferase
MSPPATVTVFRGGAIGDFVLTIPAIHALWSRYPGHTRQIVGNPGVVRLARPDKIVDINSPSLIGLYADSARPGEELSSIFGDSAVVLAYTTQHTAAFARRLGASTSARILVHDPRPNGSTEHMTSQLFAPLHACGFADTLDDPRIELTEDDLEYARRLLGAESGFRTIVISPGSGGKRKCWPMERFAAVIEQLVASGWRAVVVLGPAEEHLAGRTCFRSSDEVIVVQPPDLSRLAGLLHGADLYLGNDSGPSHIAAAVGAPSVILFGPTDPDLWAPRGRSVEVIRSPDGDMDLLKVDPVLESLMGTADRLPENRGQ